MKNSVKWAIIAVLLVAIIGGSTVLYNTLSKDYKVNNIVVYSSDKETAEMMQAMRMYQALKL